MAAAGNKHRQNTELLCNAAVATAVVSTVT